MFVVIEKDNEDAHLSYWGPFKTFSGARLFAQDRIALALNEDWGYETDEFVLDKYNWSIVKTNEVEDYE